jgi:hypothetical protein
MDMAAMAAVMLISATTIKSSINVNPRARRILRPVRRLALIALLTLVACRRTHKAPVVEPETPPPPAPVATQEAPPPSELELRVKVEPSGEVSEAAITGAPQARTCVTELMMRKLRLPTWRGNSTLFSVALLSTGNPVMPVGDAG